MGLLKNKMKILPIDCLVEEEKEEEEEGTESSLPALPPKQIMCNVHVFEKKNSV